MESKLVKMLKVLIDDLISSVEQSNVGYRKADAFELIPSEKKELLKSGIIERNPRGLVRLNFRNRSIRQRLKSFDIELKQLEYFLKNIGIIRSDHKRLENASRILDKICERLKAFPGNWAIVIALGWWKMLELSGMPALTDEILSEGFSPKDWALKAVPSSIELAKEVAEDFGEIGDLNKEIGLLKETGIDDVRVVSLSSDVDPEAIQKIKRVLRWPEATQHFTQQTVKVLGFSWFSIFILESADLMPASEEVSPKFIEAIWSNIEGLLETNRSALLQELEEMINRLNSMMEQLVGKEVNWAENIFRLPEIV